MVAERTQGGYFYKPPAVAWLDNYTMTVIIPVVIATLGRDRLYKWQSNSVYNRQKKKENKTKEDIASPW